MKEAGTATQNEAHQTVQPVKVLHVYTEPATPQARPCRQQLPITLGCTSKIAETTHTVEL